MPLTMIWSDLAISLGSCPDASTASTNSQGLGLEGSRQCFILNSSHSPDPPPSEDLLCRTCSLTHPTTLSPHVSSNCFAPSRPHAHGVVMFLSSSTFMHDQHLVAAFADVAKTAMITAAYKTCFILRIREFELNWFFPTSIDS